MIRVGLTRSRKAMPVEVVGYEADEAGNKKRNDFMCQFEN